MKSASKRLCSMVMALLLCAMTALSAYGCGGPTFLPSGTDADNSPPQNGDTPSTEDTEPSTGGEINAPSSPIYYDKYTGLACEESISSCRPLSICIGNFDGNRQQGLTTADLLIEAPVSSGGTRLWAMSANWSAIPFVSNVSSALEYMLPIANSFGAITAYNGVTTSNGRPLSPRVDGIDATQGHTAYFQGTGGEITTDGQAMHTAAIGSGYTLRAPSMALPYRFAPEGAIYAPTGNEVSSVSFSFGEGLQVGFSYDSTKNAYLRTQNGAPHTDTASGAVLQYENVILLLHDVTYTHTADGTHFTLSSENGGGGYYYTGGRAAALNWSYAEDGSLSLTDKNGETIQLNRGKTYIGLIKITDSATIVAR